MGPVCILSLARDRHRGLDCTQTTNCHELPRIATHCHELPRIATNWYILGFVRIRGILQISCPNRDALRLCYDTGTIELRIFVGFGSNRSNIVNNSLRFTRIDTNTARTLGISYESVKNMPNASTNQVRLKLNLWLFLTIQGIYPQDRYKNALVCFGVYSWDSWQIRSRFVVNPRIHESSNELRIPTNAYESITIQLRCLRMHYGFVTN